ncbi:hypothetical protein EDD15DRAFT_298548 [Pisolithus albus]|nr:hypothetical protein EDD15DRAFT_298548 [Pisolithus albus]
MNSDADIRSSMGRSSRVPSLADILVGNLQRAVRHAAIVSNGIRKLFQCNVKHDFQFDTRRFAFSFSHHFAEKSLVGRALQILHLWKLPRVHIWLLQRAVNSGTLMTRPAVSLACPQRLIIAYVTAGKPSNVDVRQTCGSAIEPPTDWPPMQVCVPSGSGYAIIAGVSPYATNSPAVSARDPAHCLVFAVLHSKNQERAMPSCMASVPQANFASSSGFDH